MKSFLLLPLLLCSVSAQAQMASASIFRSMSAENPAVISERPAATIALLFKRDSIEKKQDTVAPITSSESEIEINNSTFFYGGKGGGAFTMELYGEMANGTKEDTVAASGVPDVLKVDSDLTMFSVSAGFLDNFGLGVKKITNEVKQTGSISVNSKSELLITTIGAIFNLGLDMGVFYQHAPLDSVGGAEINMSRIGIGTGFKSKSFHLEIAYIKNIEEEKEELGGGSGPGENVMIHNPAKIMTAIEFKLGSLTLGLTSNYYMEGFFDFNNLMYYTMVMASNKENRLENTFNFSLGGEKGHSFSGAVTIASVESQESPPNLLSGSKYKTTTDIMGFQLSYSYAF